MAGTSGYQSRFQNLRRKKLEEIPTTDKATKTTDNAEEKDFRTKFIEWLLQQIAPSDPTKTNRQMAAELRGILRGTSSDYYRAAKYITPFLGEKESKQDQWFYLVAGLLASHPKQQEGISLGKALRELRADSGSLDNRFLSLLNTPSESLASALRQAISLLAQKGQSLDYALLLRDLSYWDSDDNWVQKSLARDYFR
jgi:CRISPR type I-E-associated protein CasB/Cse2